MSENDASPPRITRPSRPMPSLSARARLSTPTIAATPSAMQRRKMRKPASPPRRSRKAKRRIGARVGGETRPDAGAFTPFSPREKTAATPFSLGEKGPGPRALPPPPPRGRGGGPPPPPGGRGGGETPGGGGRRMKAGRARR